MLWAAIIWSVLALLWLAGTNAKRRRVLGLPPLRQTPRAWPGWVLSIAPGVVLLFIGTNADLVNWMGAVCAFGWMAVAVRPSTLRRGADWLDEAGQKFETYLLARLKR